ncbi:inner membrane complex protein [Gregarina niphandrodes]|uniref:Inner membrane complex protein n=1 Tax=Gregarina niphandrodes TaxID=110365 RepID=A0A023B2B7_GRENI|nr:inner membrane complex protein [Gregarina niphandrodes]EZG51580.1 inner membrane complex protein [Gregarina niphandrodes]|eukprot:XP_011131940.1 inner membrane complex protein [Gregarina niphandrodes]
MAYAPSPTLLRTASRMAWKKPSFTEEIVEEVYQGGTVMSPAKTPTPTTQSPASAKEGVRWSPTPHAHTPIEALSFAPALPGYNEGVPAADYADPRVATNVPSGLAASGLVPGGLAPSGLAPSGLAPNGLASSSLASRGLAPTGLAPGGQYGDQYASQAFYATARQPLMQRQPLSTTQRVLGQSAGGQVLMGGQALVGDQSLAGGQSLTGGSRFVHRGTELNPRIGAEMAAELRPNPLATLPRSASHVPYTTQVSYQLGAHPSGVHSAVVQPTYVTGGGNVAIPARYGTVGRGRSSIAHGTQLGYTAYAPQGYGSQGYGSQGYDTQGYGTQGYGTQIYGAQSIGEHLVSPRVAQQLITQQPVTQQLVALQPVTQQLLARHPVTLGNSTGPSAHSASVVAVPAGSVIGESWEERRVRVPRKVVREALVEEDAVLREKVVEVARPIVEERVVEVPEIQYVEELVQVPEVVYKERVVQGPEVDVQERPVYIPKTEYVDRVVEVPTVNYREVPVRKVVRVPVKEEQVRVKEVPVPVISETTQDIVTKVDRPYEVPVIHPLPFEVKTTLHQRLPQLVAQPGHTHEYNVYLPRVNEVPVNRHLVSDATAEQIERERERLFSCLQNGMDAHTLVRELDLHKAENRVEETIVEIQQWGKDNLTQNYPRIARAQGTGLTAPVAESPTEVYSQAAGGMHMGGMHMGGMQAGAIRSRRADQNRYRPTRLRRLRTTPRRYQHASSVDSFKNRTANDCSFFGAPLLDRIFGQRRYRSDQDSGDVGSWDSQHWDNTPLYYKSGAVDANPSVWSYIVKQHPDFYN